MGHRIENNCVCCDIPCVNCGRKHEEVWYCDKCEEYVDERHPLYDDGNGNEICFECFKEELNQIYCDDCDCERCSDCAREVEVLYQIDGELFCEECLEKYLDRFYRIEVN